jgi:hypothetical protein
MKKLMMKIMTNTPDAHYEETQSGGDPRRRKLPTGTGGTGCRRKGTVKTV